MRSVCVSVRTYVCACAVCARVRACVSACVGACVCACVRASVYFLFPCDHSGVFKAAVRQAVVTPLTVTPLTIGRFRWGCQLPCLLPGIA